MLTEVRAVWLVLIELYGVIILRVVFIKEEWFTVLTRHKILSYWNCNSNT